MLATRGYLSGALIDRTGSSQVDIDEYEVEREARQVQVVLALDGSAMLDVVGGGPDGVVHRGDDGEQPGDNCQDLVGNDSRRGVSLPLREGVCYMIVRSGRVTSPRVC